MLTTISGYEKGMAFVTLATLAYAMSKYIPNNNAFDMIERTANFVLEVVKVALS